MLFRLNPFVLRPPVNVGYRNLPPLLVGNILASAVSQPLPPNSGRQLCIFSRRSPAVPGPSIFPAPVLFPQAPYTRSLPVPRLLPKLPSDVMKDKENRMIAELKKMIAMYGTEGAVKFLRKNEIDLSYTNSTI